MATKARIVTSEGEEKNVQPYFLMLQRSSVMLPAGCCAIGTKA